MPRPFQRIREFSGILQFILAHKEEIIQLLSLLAQLAVLFGDANEGESGLGEAGGEGPKLVGEGNDGVSEGQG